MATSQRVSFGGSTVVRVKMKPALDQTRIEELMRSGIGVIDFGSGASVESDAASGGTSGAQTRSFDEYIEFTKRGGYAVLTNKGNDLIVVGYADGPCAMFIDEEYKNEVITEKAFRLDRFAVIDGTAEANEQIADLVHRYDPLQAMTKIKQEENKQTVYDTFHAAEEADEVCLK